MISMFYGAGSFNQSLSSWNTANVTNMAFMFQSAISLTGQDFSAWAVSKVTNYSQFLVGAGSGNIEPNWNP